MDEFLKADAAGPLGVVVEDDLVDGLVFAVGAEGSKGVSDFWMWQAVREGLIRPVCSLSKMSKDSLISRMSVSVSPGRS